MQIDLILYLIVCPLVFLAGFIDSIAGGGGILSLPAYLFAGIPAHLAAGTNKFAASLGTTVSCAKYIRSGKVHLKSALLSALGALLGGAVGASLALQIREDVLRTIILITLPAVAVFMTAKRGFGQQGAREPAYSPLKTALLSLLIGVVIGTYDGLIGPGTGTFLILAYTGILGTDLLVSSGCAKIVNLSSNLASLTVYLLSGKVLYLLGIPAALCCMLGNYAGARYAIKGGSQNVRRILFLVMALLFIKFALELFGVQIG